MYIKSQEIVSLMDINSNINAFNFHGGEDNGATRVVFIEPTGSRRCHL